MKRKGFSDMECTIARAVDAVCDPWTLLIIRQAFLGARRFQQFEMALAVPPNTLTRRLNDLVARGFFYKHRYQAHPPRHEYLLTKQALDLMPLFLALARWGRQHRSPGGPPLELVDAATGRRVDPVVVDRHTGQELTPGTVAVSLGRGASQGLRQSMQRAGLRRVVLGAQDGRGIYPTVCA
jgi:DNA-binding HxlR family transcriptional regulator